MLPLFQKYEEDIFYIQDCEKIFMRDPRIFWITLSSIGSYYCCKVNCISQGYLKTQCFFFNTLSINQSHRLTYQYGWLRERD